MKDSDHFSSYVIFFHRHSSLQNWDSTALLAQFKSNLCDRLLDDLTLLDRDLDNLPSLQQWLQRADNRYWTRVAQHNSRHSNQASASDSDSYISNSSSSDSASNDPSSPPSPLISSSTPSSIPKSPPNLPQLPAKWFDAQGRLTQKEKERRIRLHLCMYHGIKHPDDFNCPSMSRPTLPQASSLAPQPVSGRLATAYPTDLPTTLSFPGAPSSLQGDYTDF